MESTENFTYIAALSLAKFLYIGQVKALPDFLKVSSILVRARTTFYQRWCSLCIKPSWFGNLDRGSCHYAYNHASFSHDTSAIMVIVSTRLEMSYPVYYLLLLLQSARRIPNYNTSTLASITPQYFLHAFYLSIFALKSVSLIGKISTNKTKY